MVILLTDSALFLPVYHVLLISITSPPIAMDQCADGYAIFGAITAIQAVQAQNAAHPRCVILIEGGEESDIDDLPHYIHQLRPRIGTVRKAH